MEYLIRKTVETCWHLPGRTVMAAVLTTVMLGACESEPRVQVWQGAVAPGTCGISRRIPLPTSSASDYSTTVSRQAEGFVVGPWTDLVATPTLRWLHVDPRGELTAYAAGQGRLGPVARLSMGAPNQVIEVSPRRIDSDANGTIYETTMLSPDHPEPGPAQTLLSAFYRGTIRAVSVAALDGQHGVFAVGHIAVQQPQVALMGASGALIGKVATLATELWDCDAVLPTARAGVFSAVDTSGDSTDTFRLLELSESGGTALEASFPLRRANLPDGAPFCPRMVLTPVGLTVLALESEVGWRLHAIARDGTVTTQSWNSLPGPPSALAVSGDTLMAVIASPGGSTIVKRGAGPGEGAGPTDQLFPLPFPASTHFTAIPAEAGALFLDVVVRDAADVGSREIVEVRCP